jgi:hypothetical protein
MDMKANLRNMAKRMKRHVALIKRKDYLFPPRTGQNWNKDNQPHPEAWAPTNQWAVQN